MNSIKERSGPPEKPAKRLHFFNQRMREFNPQDQSAVRIVAQMDELFAIDAQARQERLGQEDRQLLRLEKFKPLARS
jgi:hypothetical protein